MMVMIMIRSKLTDVKYIYLSPFLYPYLSLSLSSSSSSSSSYLRGPLDSAGCYIDLGKVVKDAGVTLGPSGHGAKSGSGKPSSDTIISAMGPSGVVGGSVMARTAGRGFAVATQDPETKESSQSGQGDGSQGFRESLHPSSSTFSTFSFFFSSFFLCICQVDLADSM